MKDKENKWTASEHASVSTYETKYMFFFFCIQIKVFFSLDIALSYCSIESLTEMSIIYVHTRSLALVDIYSMLRSHSNIIIIEPST